MKRLKHVLMVVSVILVVMVVAVACGPKTFDLILKLKKGESYTLKSIMTMKLDQELLGEKMNMKQRFVAEQTFTVEERIDQEKYQVKVNFKDADMELVINSGGMNVMSQELTDELKGLFTNYNMQIQVTNRGEISTIEGIEGFRNSLIEQVNQQTNLTEAQKRENLLAVQGILNEEMLKSSWGRTFAYIPKKSVEVGESWVEDLILTDPLPCTISSKYTLKSVTKDEYVIDVSGEAKTDQSTATSQGARIEGTVQSVIKGEYVLDRSNGWLKRAQITQDVSAVMSTDLINEKKEIPVNLSMSVEMSGY